MASEINVSQLCESIKDLYNIYQNLETTNDIEEDNPAFDYICDIAEGLYNSCIDLMALVVDHPDADKDLVREYKQILDDIHSCDEYSESDFEDFLDDLPKFY
ncbi:MAG: hypothetical protein J6S85_26685 [Methanobrevibacter sp.]|nr:hypothetical protein [Methanobrevibacter sp.]MBO7717182.1 hypothetical protein [Methanobrevibacter sp.]